MPAVDLTARLARDSRRAEKDTILFDKALPGFGLRIHPSGRKVWIVQARIEGRSRRIVIARHGEMELAEARRPRHARPHPRGGEPRRRNPTGEAGPDLAGVRRRVLAPLRTALEAFGAQDRAHLPQGPRPARARDAPRPHRPRGCGRVVRRGEQGQARRAANRALEILRAMMFRAEEWGLRERGSNPCLGIAKNPRKQVARFLDTDELARLGRSLDAHEARWPEAIAAIRLLALTGCRRSEVLNLRWRDIGADAINLPEFEDRPARGAARRGRAGAHQGASRCARPPPRTCFRDTPRVGVRIAPQRVGGRYATTRSSAACASMTFVIPQPVRPSCPAKICPWPANFSVIDGTEPPRATHILPTGILSRRRSRWEALSPPPWEAAPMAPKASSGVRPCAVEPDDDRLHHRTARRVIARKRT